MELISTASFREKSELFLVYTNCLCFLWGQSNMYFIVLACARYRKSPKSTTKQNIWTLTRTTTMSSLTSQIQNEGVDGLNKKNVFSGRNLVYSALVRPKGKKNTGRSSDMLPNFDHLGIKKKISNQLSSFLIKLIGHIHVLPSFENMKKVCDPHIILKETDAKLKRWSKFGLLRYRCF